MVKYTLPDLPSITPEELDANTPLLEYLTSQIMKNLTQKQDLHGRRIGKAKDAIKPQDYITQRQTTPTLIGTVATRPDPRKYKNGTTFYATDRGVTYIAIDGHWYYYGGTQYDVLASKPSPSVLYDVGYLFYATDYSHLFRWSGITWIRLNDTSLYIKGFQIAPTQSGWGLCDGSTYTYSKDDGTTGSITTPNLTSVAKFIKYGSTYISSIAAAAPTIGGGSLTGSATIGGTITVTGTATLPPHQHGLSELVLTGRTTGINNSDHDHDVSESLAFFYSLSGSAQAVHHINNPTSGESDPHDHNETDVDFSEFKTDDSDPDGPWDGIDMSGVTFDPSTLTVDTSGMGISSITAGTDGTPIAAQFIPYIRL